MASKKYVCSDCGAGFTFSWEPSYCPKCGSADIGPDREKAKARMQKSVDRCWELLPQIEEAFSEYIWLVGEYEDNLQLIRQYKRRGVKLGATVHTLWKPKINNVLKAYRANRANREPFMMRGEEIDV